MFTLENRMNYIDYFKLWFEDELNFGGDVTSPFFVKSDPYSLFFFLEGRIQFWPISIQSRAYEVAGMQIVNKECKDIWKQ